MFTMTTCDPLSRTFIGTELPLPRCSQMGWRKSPGRRANPLGLPFRTPSARTYMLDQRIVLRRRDTHTHTRKLLLFCAVVLCFAFFDFFRFFALPLSLSNFSLHSQFSCVLLASSYVLFPGISLLSYIFDLAWCWSFPPFLSSPCACISMQVCTTLFIQNQFQRLRGCLKSLAVVMKWPIVCL